MISLSITLGIIASVIGVVIGALLAGKSFDSNVYDHSNALDLLREERIEEWNVLRDLNPNWVPNLSGIDLQKLDLRGVNLNGMSVGNANFGDSDLSFATLVGASIKYSRFDRARLYCAVFDQADLVGCNFAGADLNKISIEDAEFDDPRLEQVQSEKFNDITEFVRVFRHDTEALNRLNGKQLKELIVFLLIRSMFTLHDYVDGDEVGPDILASRTKLDRKLDYLAECKYYPADKTIGVATIEAFAVQKARQRVDVALLITNSQFSTAAQTLAQYEDIKLIDRKLLLIWILTIKTPDHFLDILDSL